MKHEEQFLIGEESDLVEFLFMIKRKLIKLNVTLKKRKLIEKFRNMVNRVEHQSYLDTFKLVLELLDKAQHEPTFHKTIEGLAHF